MFAKAYQWNQSIDTYQEADASHFKLRCVQLYICTSTLYVFWKQTLNPLWESDCVAISGL